MVNGNTLHLGSMVNGTTLHLGSMVNGSTLHLGSMVNGNTLVLKIYLYINMKLMTVSPVIWHVSYPVLLPHT
jgi:hypothetical protein